MNDGLTISMIASTYLFLFHGQTSAIGFG